MSAPRKPIFFFYKRTGEPYGVKYEQERFRRAFPLMDAFDRRARATAHTGAVGNGPEVAGIRTYTGTGNKGVKWDSKGVRTPPLVSAITVISYNIWFWSQRGSDSEDPLCPYTTSITHQRPAPPPRDLEQAAARSLRLPGQTSRFYARCECCT